MELIELRLQVIVAPGEQLAVDGFGVGGHNAEARRKKGIVFGFEKFTHVPRRNSPSAPPSSPADSGKLERGRVRWVNARYRK